MEMQMRHVPIAEFKDHLSELVAAAAGGEEIVITRHGKIAARLVPPDSAERRKRVEAAIERIREHQKRMRAEGRTATIEEIIAWKNEGRP
jgi:prevent-host-death family protein